MSPSEINNASMLRKGTILRGIYRIDSYLSSGGFGNTYVATNIEFDEQVAIKEFFMKGITQRDGNQTTVSVSNSENKDSFLEQREKFKKEARRIRQLKNEHIVTVHDLFDENGTSYYVMDYVDGENLAERLKRTGRAMTESEVRLILPKILDALKAVHEAGIWHLDLKPANIMLGKDGLVKLIDFGASKQLNSQKGGATTGTAITYTNGYAPREQMEQNYDKFGPWTDIYALGATLYTLLTNKRPPLPSDIDEDISEDKHLALPFPESVSENMKSFVLKMLHTNRNLRPQSVDELLVIVKTISDNNLESFDEVKGDSTIEEDEQSLDENTTLSTDNSENTAFRKELLEKALNGDAESQTTLGLCFFSGSDGFPLDYSKAFEWFTKAAEQGHAFAQNNIGLCYYYGEGVLQDYSKSFEWFEKGAEQGNEFAQINLGNCYYYGEGAKQDYTKAVEWYIKAAEQGNPEAQYQLGVCYIGGYGITQDYHKSIEWFTKAAEQGHEAAKNNLRELTEKASPHKAVDVPRQNERKYYFIFAFLLILFISFIAFLIIYNSNDVSETEELPIYYSEELFREADLGNAEAQYALGLCYYEGSGISEDHSKAAEWWGKSADQGNMYAQYNLGLCYFNGDGIEYSLSQGLQFLTKSASQGLPEAQFVLGSYYEQGKDIGTAVTWYKKAAEQGLEDAIKKLKELNVVF